METMRRWFHFEKLDYRTAQLWLNGLGAEGWQLTGRKAGRLCFERPDPAQVSYAVDLERTDPEEEREYLRLCADAGWKHVLTVRGMYLFMAEPGIRPTPLHTDPALELRTLGRTAASRVVWYLILLAIQLSNVLLHIHGRGPLPGWYWIVGAVLYCVGIALQIILPAADLLRCRRAAVAGKPMPVTGVRTLWRRTALQWVLVAVLLLWSVFGLLTLL